MNGKIRVTVIATGLGEEEVKQDRRQRLHQASAGGEDEHVHRVAQQCQAQHDREGAQAEHQVDESRA